VPSFCNLTTRVGKKEKHTLQVLYDQRQENIDRIIETYDEFVCFSKQTGIDLVLTTAVPAPIGNANLYYISGTTFSREILPTVRSGPCPTKKLEKDVTHLNELMST
jgi:hypothetical protein